MTNPVPPPAEQVRDAELWQTYEELEVAIEELRVQNEELLAMRMALDAQRQRYRELFELAPDGYLVTDLEGVIVEANQAAGALLGVAPTSLIGKPLATYLRHPELHTLYNRLRLLRLGEERLGTWETVIHPRKREPFHASFHIAVGRDDGGTPARLRWLIRDVSEQVLARQRIEELAAQTQQQAEELDAIFEAMIESVVVYDFHDRPVRANRAARLAYGRALEGSSRAEIVRLLHLRHPDGRPISLAESPIDRALQGEIVQGLPFLFRHANGEDRHMLASAVPLHVDGQAVGAVVVWHDVTAQVRDRQRIEELAREATERADELDIFAHMVAHDLKQPLSSILGCAGLLAEELAERSGDDYEQDLVKRVLDGSLQMRALVDSLLLLASTRSQEVELAPLDVGEIVRKVRRNLEPQIQETSAEVGLPATWPVAQAYGPWLESVWTNYLGNALKYGGNPPRVELGWSVLGRAAEKQALAPAGLDRLPPSIPDRGAKVLFWVCDHGPGLSGEEQAQLFKPFTRLAGVRGAGHGLGLAIVQRIVRRLGGEVGVESHPGQGSTFWFTLHQASITPPSLTQQ